MGHLEELPKSGGQSSARRVMKGLEKSGFEVVPIRRHRAELEGWWKHQLEIMTFAVVDLLKIVGKMIFGKRQGAAFLHLTYAGPLVPYELLLTHIVKLMGYKSLIYLKGGQVLDYYATGSNRHKRFFKKTMDLQEKVFFEGMESLEMAKKITNTPLVYFPNYVFDERIPTKLPEKPRDEINILYFGRVAPNKNVHIGIEAFNILAAKYPNMHYTIVGGIGQIKAYGEQIDKMISASPYNKRIKRIGLSSQDYLLYLMQTQHFFLFPSKEKAEGHSNSLNEAMSQGLIPIVSDYHFNRSIVGNDELIVDGFDALSYANKIDEIIKDGDMKVLSHDMWERVRTKFAYNIVINTIKRELLSV